MKTPPCLLICLFLTGTSVATLRGDYIALPVKWSQPVVYDVGDPSLILGADRLSDHTAGLVHADDFTCNDPRPVVAVRWWGSYIGAPVARPNSVGFSVPFDVAFHLSNANGNPALHPLSLPLDPLLLLQPVLAQEFLVGTDQAGDFVYRYDAYLPTPFEQMPGTEYFLVIDKPTGENWGWHTTQPSPIQDYAAFAPGHGGPWTSSFVEGGYDLAFEIMVPEPGSLVLLGLGFALLIRRRTAA